MYDVKSDVLEQYASDSREIYVRAMFNGTHYIDGEYIKAFTVTETASGNNDSLSLGNTCSNKLELDMFMPPSDGYTYVDATTGEEIVYNSFTGLSAANIFIETGVEVNGTVVFSPIGMFFVDSYESTDEFKSVNITAFDGMLKIDKELGNRYKCAIPLRGTNVTAINIITDILTQAGISPSYIGDPVYGGTTYKVWKRAAAGITYDNNGHIQKSNTSIGTISPFKISPTARNDIDFRLQSDSQDFPDSIKVLYFADADGETLLSIENYEVDTEYPYDSGLGWEVDVQTTIPTHTEEIYVAYCTPVTNYNTSDLKLYISLNQNCPEIVNYVNESAKFIAPAQLDASPRTILGYMAGLLGCNAMFDNRGRFIIKRLGGNSRIDITRDEQYMSGYEKATETSLTVSYVTTGTEPNSEGQGQIITVGSGSFGLNYSNPYFAQLTNVTPTQAVSNIYNLYSGLSFTPGKVRYRFNPSIELGDEIYIEGSNDVSYKSLAIGHTISMTGGLSATVECNVTTDHKADFITTPTSKKLSYAMDDFLSKYQNIVQGLTGVNGGYVKFVMDSQQNIRAVAITENDVELAWDEVNEKVTRTEVSAYYEPMWVFSYAGLYYSANEGANVELALTMNGEIYANKLMGQSAQFGDFYIDNGDLTAQGGFFADYVGTYKAYRVFIQPAYYDAQEHTAANTLVVSTQTADINNGVVGDYAESFVLHADRRVDAHQAVYIGGELSLGNKIVQFRQNGNQNIFSDSNNAWRFGEGAYNLTTNDQTVNSVYSGGEIYLRAKNDDCVRIQKGTTTRFSLGIKGWKIGSETQYSNRDTIESAGGFVLSANGGDNALTIVASQAHSYCNTTVHGDLTVATQLYVSGNIYTRHRPSSASPAYITTDGILTYGTSSKRYKENITAAIPDDLNPDKLYQLPVYVYNYKEEHKDKQLVDGTQIGILAEDVEKHYPNALIRNSDGQAESWQDRIMIPAMLKLIQDQKKQIDELEQRVEQLEKEQ